MPIRNACTSNSKLFMPPPSQLYVVGSESYRHALQSGYLHVSLPPEKANLPPTSKGVIVSPTLPSLPDHDHFRRSLGDSSSSSSNPTMQRQICPSDALDEAHAAYSAASELDGASDEDSSRKRKLPECNICFEKTRFSDIIGHGAAKVRIEELLLPLALPPAVANAVLTGVRALPASLLLHGPPGCGKVGRLLLLRCVIVAVIARSHAHILLDQIGSCHCRRSTSCLSQCCSQRHSQQVRW